MTAIGQMMGDPGTDTELQEVRAAMRAERAKQERDLAAALNEDRATKRPPVTAQPPAQRRPVRWIAPGLTGRGELLLVIDRNGEPRLRVAVIRAMQGSANSLTVRVAVEAGQVLIEPCAASDRYARRVRGDGTIQGGSLRRELREAGFAPGCYPIVREPDGCWVASATERKQEAA